MSLAGGNLIKKSEMSCAEEAKPFFPAAELFRQSTRRSFAKSSPWFAPQRLTMGCPIPLRLGGDCRHHKKAQE